MLDCILLKEVIDVHKYNRLHEVEYNKLVEIKAFEDEIIGSKLLSMGIYPGHFIKKIRSDLFNKTILVQCDNLTVALRCKEASAIVVT